jgi:hypothetical protein
MIYFLTFSIKIWAWWDETLRIKLLPQANRLAQVPFYHVTDFSSEGFP